MKMNNKIRKFDFKYLKQALRYQRKHPDSFWDDSSDEEVDLYILDDYDIDFIKQALIQYEETKNIGTADETEEHY